MAKVLVLRTAGVNCDEETAHAFRLAGGEVSVLHVGSLLRGEERLEEFDVLAIPGGFSYGDDLGAGTVLANQLRTRLAGDLHDFVDEGKLVIGICNGFQVLTETGLLPGVLLRNAGLKYICRTVGLRVETSDSAFTQGYNAGDVLNIPIAHHDGNYYADEATLAALKGEGRIAFAYTDNPNGSQYDIAGILSDNRRVLGMMPHPERAADAGHGGTDGTALFRALTGALTAA